MTAADPTTPKEVEMLVTPTWIRQLAYVTAEQLHAADRETFSAVLADADRISGVIEKWSTNVPMSLIKEAVPNAARYAATVEDLIEFAEQLLSFLSGVPATAQPRRLAEKAA